MTMPGFAVLYRWRIKPGHEADFVAAWSFFTEHYLSRHHALGSRLHRAEDGTWYAYAQWPDAATRELAFATETHDRESPQIAAQLEAAVLERFPEVRLRPVADYLCLPLTVHTPCPGS